MTFSQNRKKALPLIFKIFCPFSELTLINNQQV